MVFARGLSMVSLFAAGLLVAASGCGGKATTGGGTPTAGSDNKKLILGEWEHKKGDTLITFKFTANKVDGSGNQAGGAKGSFSGSYSITDNTLELPKFGAPGEDKVTIDSITADKLVLSGGTGKFDKTEFTHPGSASASNGGDKASIVGTWEMTEGGPPGLLAEFTKDGSIKMIVGKGADGKDVVVTFKYTLDGDKLQMNKGPGPDGKDRIDLLKVVKLTDKELVLEQKEGGKVETQKFKKK